MWQFSICPIDVRHPVYAIRAREATCCVVPPGTIHSAGSLHAVYACTIVRIFATFARETRSARVTHVAARDVETELTGPRAYVVFLRILFFGFFPIELARNRV